MEKTRVFGRLLRLLFGVTVAVMIVPVYLRAGTNYNLASTGVAVGLVVIYIVLHFVVMRLLPEINRWIGALVALFPVAFVFILGQGGGPLFGQGEGATGALTFLAMSFFIDFIRADSGCKVMAIPGLLFRNRTPLACLALTPVDLIERKIFK